MSSSSRARTRRLTITPICTSYNDIADRPCTPRRRRPSPLTVAVPLWGLTALRRAGLRSPDSDDKKGKQIGEPALEKPGDATRLTTPSGTRWTVASCPLTTPVSAIASHSHSAPPVIEAQVTESRNQAMGNSVAPNPTTDGHHPPLSPRPSRHRRCSRTAIRQLYFQRFREDLWKRGAQNFGHSERAYAFVMPVQLRRLSSETRGALDYGVALSSPLSPSGRITVRAVVHSKKRMAIGLKREFDLDTLRATIPDPLPSPCSPNFDRKALMSALETDSDARLSPSPTAGDKGHDAGAESRRSETGDTFPLSEGRYHSRAVAVPMNIQYARAQIPALAAIMMSDKVQPGDTIDLAVPHPRAWSETVAYVYTGEEELLTEQVKENILYLGGKV